MDRCSVGNKPKAGSPLPHKPLQVCNENWSKLWRQDVTVSPPNQSCQDSTAVLPPGSWEPSPRPTCPPGGQPASISYGNCSQKPVCLESPTVSAHLSNTRGLQKVSEKCVFWKKHAWISNTKFHSKINFSLNSVVQAPLEVPSESRTPDSITVNKVDVYAALLSSERLSMLVPISLQTSAPSLLPAKDTTCGPQQLFPQQNGYLIPRNILSKMGECQVLQWKNFVKTKSLGRSQSTLFTKTSEKTHDKDIHGSKAPLVGPAWWCGGLRRHLQC